MRSSFTLAFVLISSLLIIFCQPALAGKPVKEFTNIGAVEKAQIIKNMIAEGYTEAAAALLLDLLKIDGKSAYQFGDTLYVGDKKEIIAGNYLVSGRNIFPDQSQFLIYVIEYKDKLPLMAGMSDDRYIIFENGSIDNFTVYKLSQDQQREYIAVYKTDPSKVHVPGPLKIKLGIRPELQHSMLKLKAFGANFLYDSEGNLLEQSLNELRRGSQDFSFSLIPGKDAKTMQTGIGFILKSKKTGQEEQYSFSGRRILADTNTFLSSGDQREVVESDIKQEIILSFSKYSDTTGTQVALYNIFKQHVEVISSGGKITKTLTKTGELCENPQKLSF
jgi:hypothetical protein